MAGVLALAVELNHGRLGNVNPHDLCAVGDPVARRGSRRPPALQYFHRDISGNNNGYSEVLGYSTLDVQNFLQLPLVQPAGAPGTPSNP
jgi:hypothetical protein